MPLHLATKQEVPIMHPMMELLLVEWVEIRLRKVRTFNQHQDVSTLKTVFKTETGLSFYLEWMIDVLTNKGYKVQQSQQDDHKWLSNFAPIRPIFVSQQKSLLQIVYSAPNYDLHATSLLQLYGQQD